jgi:hypothetical protein
MGRPKPEMFWLGFFYARGGGGGMKLVGNESQAELGLKNLSLSLSLGGRLYG